MRALMISFSRSTCWSAAVRRRRGAARSVRTDDNVVGSAFQLYVDLDAPEGGVGAGRLCSKDGVDVCVDHVTVLCLLGAAHEL